MFVESEMGEPLGLLQVTVIQGKKLVIRDFKSSDPYVIVKLGNEASLVSVFCFFAVTTSVCLCF